MKNFVPVRKAFLVASGDQRLSANQVCWPAQQEMEQKLVDAFAVQDVVLERAHPYDDLAGHGFISSQRMGMDVFRRISKDVPVVVAVAAWQYSHHVLAGLRDHQAAILALGWRKPLEGKIRYLPLQDDIASTAFWYQREPHAPFSVLAGLNGLEVI